MHWPQITYIVLTAIGVGIAAAKHGESSGNYNVGLTLIGTCFTYWLLIAGGFFS